MAQSEIFEIFSEKLNKGKFPYFITGSIASIYYGLPRLTHDVDIVLNLSKNRINEFIQLFASKEFYIPPEETIIAESNRTIRGHFNLIHFETGFKADIYLIGDDELHIWALDQRKKVKINDRSFFVAPPEYVIIRKLEFYKEGRSGKHIEDIQNMIEISSDLIDFDFLKDAIWNTDKSKFQNMHPFFKELGFVKIAPKTNNEEYSQYDLALIRYNRL